MLSWSTATDRSALSIGRRRDPLGIGGLPPGSFALVMATGIVSVALHQQGMNLLARWLFRLNLVSYGLLWLLTLVRLVLAPRRVVADLLNPSRAPGFLTAVAGSSVLGRQFVLLTERPEIAVALWVLSAALWLLLIYAFFTVLIFRERQPPIEQTVHGGWLLVVVATQAVSLLGTRVALWVDGWREPMLLGMFSLFVLGCIFYLGIGGLVLYRLFFLRPEPARLTPLYWIIMGAAAITVLAGSTLIEVEAEWSLLHLLLPYLVGSTLLFWAAATWLIPLLIALGIWRHLRMRYPLTYESPYWGMVFPLGMYTVASFETATTTGVPVLAGVAEMMVFVALGVWTIVFAGMLRRLAAILRAARVHLSP